MTNDLPARFIGIPVEVVHDEPPVMEKKPGPPDGFIWEERTYRVEALLKEWHDYQPRGKSLTFYVKEQGSFRAKSARRRGSWGVGRDYFRVRTVGDEVFDIYYDRDPNGPGGRKGTWYLFRQIFEETT